MKRPYRSVLEDSVRGHVPDDLDLFPRISAQLEMRDRSRTLRARPAIVVAAALVALGLLSGVVYALGRSLGYIPGVGIVEQTVGLRVLAEPVSVERDGITLTVTQALISSEKTIVTFQVEGIPESALARDPREGETPPPTCGPSDNLILPDGSLLSPTSAQGEGWQLGYRFRETYDPLPDDVNQVTLGVSCLLGTSPGKAPENWRILLAFIPAPPDITVLPVVEVTASPSPTLAAGTQSTGTPAASAITIERTIELDDGYVLIGSFHAITTGDGIVTSPYATFLRITDSDGNEVRYENTVDIDLPRGDEHTLPWAYEIRGKDLNWPLTITVDSMNATLKDVQASFEFDTGPTPQPGQQWTLDQDLQLGGYVVRALTASRTPTGYAFAFQSEGGITGLGVDIRSADEYVSPAGGGGGGGGNGSLGASVAYAGQIPEGKLTVVISNVMIRVPGPWSILWEPEGAARQPASSPSLGSTPCVTDEVWAQVKASVAAQIPSDLLGRFIIFGPGPDGPTFGVNLLDLASHGRKFLGEGSWPIVSPDGKKVVYTAGDGLEIHDLDSGVRRALPGTDPTDFRMVWSPDGNRIVFVRSSTNQIMRINADGSDQQQVRDNSAVYHLLVGWADATHLLITEPGPDGVYFQSLDLENGSSQNLFAMSSNKADAVVSSDGQWIAFTNSLGGMSGNGLYISHLDGSERRMVAALDGRALYFPIWSPDDRWLILSLPDPDDPVDQMAQTLVELASCRVIPLPDLGGDVYSWGR
jgi:hypothetical protein